VTASPTRTFGARRAPRLECVINISEGRRSEAVESIAAAAGSSLLDVHTDPWHHRSVLTLAGADVESAARSVARATVEVLDLRDHDGAHPRLGVLDVVPFVPLRHGAGAIVSDGAVGPSLVDLGPAITARNEFAEFVASELEVPCFLYGPERSLPEVRRRAFVTEPPDFGPPVPHPTAGAACVGARGVLVAYNLWLAVDDVRLARSIARELRCPEVRALGLELGGRAQVSCNLIAPWAVTPADVFDFVADRTLIARAELVGLLPASILSRVPGHRWPELDLGEDRTVEARLAAVGAS
jgi:glutamate formiminotransferase